MICILGSVPSLEAQGEAPPELKAGELSLKFPLIDKLVMPLDAEDFSRFELADTKYLPDRRAYIQQWVANKGTDQEESITFVHEKRKKLRISQFEFNMHQMSHRLYGSSDHYLRTLYKTRNDILLLSEVPKGCGETPPFTTIVRNCFTPHGEQYIVYERKKGTLSDDEKAIWIEKLKHAYVSDVEASFEVK